MAAFAKPKYNARHFISYTMHVYNAEISSPPRGMFARVLFALFEHSIHHAFSPSKIVNRPSAIHE
jgi:hypothetical protein